MARLVLDKLLDSGELRSVASHRALALRMHYLPRRIRFEVPGEDDFLPFLDPHKKERAADGLRDAILRVVTHEEANHWVVVDPALELDIQLRERSRLPKVTPVYEPDLHGEDTEHRLGEPRLKLGWRVGDRTSADLSEVVFRAGQGLMKVELGSRTPTFLLLEAPRGDEAIAYLYCGASMDLSELDSRGERLRRHVPARTRVPITHDISFATDRSLLRLWRRRVFGEIEVLGLARVGRPPITFATPTGERVSWDRNEQALVDVGASFILRARERDLLEVENISEAPATVLWFDGHPLQVMGSARVTVQGAHLRGLVTPGTTWSVSLPAGSVAPAPRVVTLVGEVIPASRQERAPKTAEPALFHFEKEAATIYQDAVVLSQVEGSHATIGVRRDEDAGALAVVALDDCDGAKIRQLRDPRGNPTEDVPWRQFHDVVELGPTGARVELLGQPQVTFAAPRRVGRLTTDPADLFMVGGWRIGITSDGLRIDGLGAQPIEIDGTTYRGPSHIPFQDGYRIRAGEGVYRIVRDGRRREHPDAQDS